jgi:uncharacterized protein YkwD
MLSTHLILCAALFTLGAENTTPSTSPQAAQQTKKADDTKKSVATSKQSTTKAPPADSDEKVVDGVRLHEIEANVVSYTNRERVRNGLPPFKVDKELVATAREQAAWMTRNRSLIHTSRPVAENIAMGQPSSLDVVRAWMNSPGHRANILNAAHLRIGVAAFRTEGGTIFWCQQFRR